MSIIPEIDTLQAKNFMVYIIWWIQYSANYPSAIPPFCRRAMRAFALHFRIFARATQEVPDGLRPSPVMLSPLQGSC